MCTCLKRFKKITKIKVEYEDDDNQDIEGNIDRFNADYIESESVENLDHADRIDDDGELGEYLCCTKSLLFLSFHVMQLVYRILPRLIDIKPKFVIPT